MLGADPLQVLQSDSVDYLIHVALLKQTMKLTTEQKIEEIKVLAELVGMEVAKTLAKIF
jgi:hypothetical protein